MIPALVPRRFLTKSLIIAIKSIPEQDPIDQEDSNIINKFWQYTVTFNQIIISWVLTRMTVYNSPKGAYR